MGQIILKESGEFRRHKNTLQQFDSEILDERISQVLNEIAISPIFKRKELCCYIYGMGAIPKSTYREISKLEGIDVLWFDSILPLYLRPLSFIAASYAGLIRVLSLEVLPSVFQKISRRSMAGLYIFQKSKVEQKFIDAVTKKRDLPVIDTIVKEDNSYFMYIVDTDNYESRTGIYEIVSYGLNTPTELIRIVSRK